MQSLTSRSRNSTGSLHVETQESSGPDHALGRESPFSAENSVPANVKGRAVMSAATLPGMPMPVLGKSFKRRKKGAPFFHLNGSSRLLFSGFSFFFMVATVLYGAVLGGYWGDNSHALFKATDQLIRKVGFGVEHISITGLKRVSHQAILEAISLETEKSIFSFESETAQNKLQRFTWIGRADVMRLLPSTLNIIIKERVPSAIWQKSDRYYLIDNEGHVLDEVARETHNNLPLVVGAGAGVKARQIFALLEPHENLQSLLIASVRVAKRRWNLVLSNGIEIWLPERKVAEALDFLAELEKKHALLSRDIQAVDFRLSDRVAIRMTEVVERGQTKNEGPATNAPPPKGLERDA